MMENTFKLGSLFDGSGGFPLAGAICGIEPVWASEVEPYPIAVTRSCFPNMIHLGNVMKINGAEIEPVDVLTFGFPCQDVSVAGKRKSVKHKDKGDEETTRSGLFWEAVRIIEEMRCATNGKYPRFAVFENVPGLFSAEKGETFRTVVEGLIKIVEPSAVMPDVPKKGWAYADCYIGDGWSFAYRVFDAQYIRTAQRRRRVYAVLDLGGQCARQILFERESLSRNHPSGGEAWQGTAPDVERGVGADDREGAVCYGISSYESNAMKSDNPHSGIYVADTSRTLDLNGGNPACNQGGIAIVEAVADRNILDDQGGYQISVRDDGKRPTLRAEMHGNVPCVMCYDARGNGDGQTVSTITGDHENRVTDYTSVVCEPFVKSHRATSADDATTWKHGDKSNTLNTFDLGETRCNELVVETVALEGNGQRPSHRGDGYIVTDKSYTLNATEVHGVAYQQTVGALCARDYKGVGQQYVSENKLVVENSVVYAVGNGQADQTGLHDIPGALNCMHDQQAVLLGIPPHYIVRRLTPTECARLQGFPDFWGHPDKKTDFTDEEYRFWLEVRNTHAAINRKAVKDYTKKQMLTWYNKLHNDSSEYKMWGNGIALPCALYVMEGIEDALKMQEEKQDEDWSHRR